MDTVLDDYFEWLYSQVIYGEDGWGYRKLFTMLHDMDFRYSVDYDENRALDGENLRWYYVSDGGDERIMDWEDPCTVLEALVAIALHMENITGEMDIRHWFWRMLDNLDLSWMTDRKFDREYVYGQISNFLDRDYEPDGRGNIIHIPGYQDDLREVEIWKQICWYLDSFYITE